MSRVSLEQVLQRIFLPRKVNAQALSAMSDDDVALALEALDVSPDDVLALMLPALGGMSEGHLEGQLQELGVDVHGYLAKAKDLVQGRDNVAVASTKPVRPPSRSRWPQALAASVVIGISATLGLLVLNEEQVPDRPVASGELASSAPGLGSAPSTSAPGTSQSAPPSRTSELNIGAAGNDGPPEPSPEPKPPAAIAARALRPAPPALARDLREEAQPEQRAVAPEATRLEALTVPPAPEPKAPATIAAPVSRPEPAPPALTREQRTQAPPRQRASAPQVTQSDAAAASSAPVTTREMLAPLRQSTDRVAEQPRTSARISAGLRAQSDTGGTSMQLAELLRQLRGAGFSDTDQRAVLSQLEQRNWTLHSLPVITPAPGGETTVTFTSASGTRLRLIREGEGRWREVHGIDAASTGSR